jgi:L-fucose dehydrogenase
VNGLQNRSKCGIRVNAFLPAEVLTPLYEAWVGRQPHPKGALKRTSGQIPPKGRMTTAAEIASAVVFLLSSTQSGHTTTQHIIVDGG